MFGWLFRPSCPCDARAKEWVEERLAWLANEFEDSAFTGRPIILPTHEFFPDPFDGSNKSVRLMLDRVCEYMDVDPYSVALEFKSDARVHLFVNEAGNAVPSGAAGTYQARGSRSRIQIDKAEIQEPMGLVGTIAHELAHAKLLGERRLDSKTYDNELLTDLTVIHFGLGIFLANSPRHWDGHYTKWPNSDLRKPEYMTSPMIGWALAHLAWFRNELKPAWAKHLCSAAKANFRESLRYLKTSGDSSYQPDY
jgi:hypothetical protein